MFSRDLAFIVVEIGFDFMNVFVKNKIFVIIIVELELVEVAAPVFVREAHREL